MASRPTPTIAIKVAAIAHGFEMKMLGGLVHEGLAAAIVGESVKTGGKAVEVVRFWITDAGREALAAG
jgi:hypothetical protein